MLTDELIIGMDSLLGETAALKRDGYRFVTMTALRAENARAEILYHFDRDLKLRHLRLTVNGDAPVPSITPVYFGAFLAENEIRDLFGLRFEGLVIDYRGSLLLEPAVGPAPFCRGGVTPAAAPDRPAGEAK
ncbi:MAG: NADH-quinone oxidoreductase subunit C [Desulfobacterales bacterium]